MYQKFLPKNSVGYISDKKIEKMFEDIYNETNQKTQNPLKYRGYIVNGYKNTYIVNSEGKAIIFKDAYNQEFVFSYNDSYLDTGHMGGSPEQYFEDWGFVRVESIENRDVYQFTLDGVECVIDLWGNTITPLPVDYGSDSIYTVEIQEPDLPPEP